MCCTEIKINLECCKDRKKHIHCSGQWHVCGGNIFSEGTACLCFFSLHLANTHSSVAFITHWQDSDTHLLSFEAINLSLHKEIKVDLKRTCVLKSFL